LAPLGAALVGYPSLAFARRLALERPTLTLLAAAVLAWAQVVAVAQLLSLAEAFEAGPLLVAHALLALVALFATRWVPRPPSGPRTLLVSAIRRLRGGGPEYVTLAVAVGFAALVSLILAVVVAPNNPDALSYHLSRAAYWAQEGSVFHFRGASVRQAAFPPNAEILLSWLIGLTRSDALVQLVQFAFYGLALAGVYEGARLLRFDGRAALVAALAFGCLPQVLLQASSAQNDLATAVAVGAPVLFGVRGLRSGSRGEMLVSALGLGLAVGTKATALVALAPVLGLLSLVALRQGRLPRAAAYAGVALVSILALGTANYVQNVRDFDHPLAPTSFLETAGGEAGLERSVAPPGGERPQNAVRMAWTSFVETAPLDAPVVADVLKRTGKALMPSAETTDGPSLPLKLRFGFEVEEAVDEDTSGYGLLGLVVLVPCWTWAMVRGPADRRAVAMAAAAGLVLLALTFRFSIYNGRALLPFAALAAPLMGLAAQRVWTRMAAAALAGLSVVPTVLANPSKPVLPEGGTSIFELDRREQMARRNEPFLKVDRELARRLPDDAPLGVKVGEDFLDYALFGVGFDRRVQRVAAGDDERGGVVAGRPVSAILYEGREPPFASRVVRLSPTVRLMLVGQRP